MRAKILIIVILIASSPTVEIWDADDLGDDEISSSVTGRSSGSQLNSPGFQEGSIFTNTTLAIQSDNSCVILYNGSVNCWNDGIWGLYSDLQNVDRYAPTPVGSFGVERSAVSLSAGHSTSCALLDNGSVSCWGSGPSGQLGNGVISQSIVPPGLVSGFPNGQSAIALSSGQYHSCVILENGQIACWGGGHYGALGNGLPADENGDSDDQSTPLLTTSLGDERTAIAIDAGMSHTCAILDDGNISCWGYNAYGQLGDGTTLNRNSPGNTLSLGVGRTAVAISAGEYYTCALLDNGKVTCWGTNANGQLGHDSGGYYYSPGLSQIDIGVDAKVIAISTPSRGGVSCALLENNSVYCWGVEYSTTPEYIEGFNQNMNVVSVSSGEMVQCALLENGSALCWSRYSSQELPPTYLEIDENVKTVALSERDLDGDGILNIFEGTDDFLDDSDGDGIGDSEDQCEGHDDNIDTDGDGVPDGCDNLIDSDNDGVGDSEDQCEGHDDNIDADADGIIDGCDPLVDSDNDGVIESMDQCQGHDDAIDLDNDGTPDGCDDFVDSDNDGVGDNSDQCNGYDDTIDIDGDGTSDGCDNLIDSDNDGVGDFEDQCEGHDDYIDTDADGIIDGCDNWIDLGGQSTNNQGDRCLAFVNADENTTTENCVTWQESDSLKVLVNGFIVSIILLLALLYVIRSDAIEVEIDDDFKIGPENYIHRKELIELEAKSVHYKRLIFSIIAGIVMMVPFMLMTGVGAVEPGSELDVEEKMEESPFYFAVVVIVDSLCCFYPAYLWLAKGVTIFSNPKTRIKQLELTE